MTELIVTPGEMCSTDFEVIPLKQVQELGALLLGELDVMEERSDFTLDSQFRFCVFDSREENEMDGLFEDIHTYYKGLLQDSEVNFTRHLMWLMHGKVENVAWHIDRQGDVRFMLNVGEDTCVEVAEEWDPSLYRQGDTGYPPPAKATNIELPTGSMYVANNLITDLELLKPHQTPQGQRNRIVLRSSFYAEDHWERLATNGGVPVRLASPA